MLQFLTRQGSNAQWWDGRHRGRPKERKSALHAWMGWLVVYDSVDAIAAALRNFGIAAGGVCWRRRSRGLQDGREGLVGRRGRCARAMRSLSELRLER
jgi:hypothetical protein